MLQFLNQCANVYLSADFLQLLNFHIQYSLNKLSNICISAFGGKVCSQYEQLALFVKLLSYLLLISIVLQYL